MAAAEARGAGGACLGREKCRNSAIDSQRACGEDAKNSQLHPGVPMRRLLSFMAIAAAVATPAFADPPSFAIALKNNQFVPNEVQIPAGVKVKLVVRNDNATPSEFESTQLHREKIVTPGAAITVFVGPLDPGSYEFFDDFHPQTRGRLIVK
jgi:plastocyanin